MDCRRPAQLEDRILRGTNTYQQKIFMPVNSHLFNKYVLSAYWTAGAQLGATVQAVNKNIWTFTNILPVKQTWANYLGKY